MAGSIKVQTGEFSDDEAASDAVLEVNATLEALAEDITATNFEDASTQLEAAITKLSAVKDYVDQRNQE